LRPRSRALIGELRARLPGFAQRLVIAFRLVHPFPSILDGVVVAIVALVAGGSSAAAVTLGLSMTLLQFAIGALNDIVDAPLDAGSKPGKPIPEGIVAPGVARVVVAVTAVGGVALALVHGPVVAGLALVVLAIGAWYDLWAKGTTLSWLPLAAGIPLLPVFGWYGATGDLPGVFLILVPAAANAGSALAIANSIVDIERDEDNGASSVAIALGPRRAAALVLLLHGVVAGLALATAVVLGAPTGWVGAILLAACAPLAGAGIGILAVSGDRPGWRELAFEVQALGTGLLAVAWLAALSASADLVPGA
jgi:4-hydroxybenzoate polyprenyltransferase